MLVFRKLLGEDFMLKIFKTLIDIYGLFNVGKNWEMVFSAFSAANDDNS